MKSKIFGSLILVIAVSALAGCKDQRRHEVGGAVELAAVNPLPANAPPLDVARQTLQSIEEAQTSRANGLGSPAKRQVYSDAMARIAALSAKADILKNLKQAASYQVPKNLDEKGAVTMTVESWISLLAHYAGGYQWDSLKYKTQPSDTSATVYLEAANPGDAEHFRQISSTESTEQGRRSAALKMGFNIPIQAGIEVRLIKVDGQWRVTRIELGPAKSEIAATKPTKAG